MLEQTDDWAALSVGQSGEKVKKVKVDALRPGIYVCDLNAGWLDHPFLFKRFKIKSIAEIEKIRSYGIREVFIDTSRGDDVEDAPTAQQVAEETSRQMRAVIPPAQPSRPRQKTPLAEEIARARRILDQSAQLLQQVLTDARLGNPLDLEDLQRSSRDIAASVIRNPSAMALVCQLRQRHEYTFYHSLNVSVLLTSFSHHLGHELASTQALALGGLLHDIGKMVVDAAVLNKPGKLSQDEFSHIKTHVERGMALVQCYGLPEEALAVIHEHHERQDGSGYPRALPLSKTSLAGRMAAIVDVYDAISSDRCYHRGLSAPAAMQRIFEWQGHFDEELVGSFVRTVGIYPVGSLVRLSSQRLAIVVEHDLFDLLRPKVRVIFDLRRQAYVTAEDINLAAPRWAGRESIEGHENPARWQIDIRRHVQVA
jgi:putative nucleotidyltransferase with HDIG domain